MTKDLNKVKMNRSRLHNKFLRNKTNFLRKEYRKQKNFCSNPLRKAKKDNFAKLDISSVTDNKLFWQTVKPLFSNQAKSHRALNLIEKDQLIEMTRKLLKFLMNILLILTKN